jgi:hypothetical protein
VKIADECFQGGAQAGQSGLMVLMRKEIVEYTGCLALRTKFPNPGKLMVLARPALMLHTGGEGFTDGLDQCIEFVHYR